MRALRVLVCGGRHYENWDRVVQVLDGLSRGGPPIHVIQGGAAGADSMARVWAANRGHTYDTYPADWAVYGKAAGPVRNQEMLEKGCPDLTVAFPGNRGTTDMVERARRRGVSVLLVDSVYGELVRV